MSLLSHKLVPLIEFSRIFSFFCSGSFPTRGTLPELHSGYFSRTTALEYLITVLVVFTTSGFSNRQLREPSRAWITRNESLASSVRLRTYMSLCSLTKSTKDHTLQSAEPCLCRQLRTLSWPCAPCMCACTAVVFFAVTTNHYPLVLTAVIC